MFKYLDLGELKIKETNEPFITVKVNVPLITSNPSLLEIKEGVLTALNTIQPTKVGWRFHGQQFKRARVVNIVFEVDDCDEDTFTIVTNVLMAIFLSNIALEGGRPRERRLDVPEDLKAALNVPLIALKNAINHRTMMDCFNVEIVSNEFAYKMIGDNNE